MAISGTGVRNNFAVADEAARKRDVQMVKDWIVAASKLGAPVIRVFSGTERPTGYTFDQALDWMVSDFKQCAAFGKEHGVMVGLQQHNDFLKTAAETIRVIEAVDSPWFGCILDIGHVTRSAQPVEASGTNWGPVKSRYELGCRSAIPAHLLESGNLDIGVG